jgi:putative ABC transport system permease protein
MEVDTMGKFLRMSWRNVWRNWRRTVISIIAITLALTLLLFFDGMLGGGAQSMFSNWVRLQGGHIQAHALGYRERAKHLPLMPLADTQRVIQAAAEQPEVVAVSRRITTGGMISGPKGAFPIAIIGLEPDQEASVGLLAEKITDGRYLAPGDQHAILIGKALADGLGVTVGQPVTLVGRALGDQMNNRTVTIVGLYDLGLAQIEKHMAYINLSDAQTLVGLPDQTTEVVISLEKMGQEEKVMKTLRAALPDYQVDAWYVLNPEMKQVMAMNNQMMGAFGIFLLLIAAVGILNLLLMAVFERTREIGLLAAMGLKRAEIMTLFMLEGLWIGLLGAMFGLALGGGIVAYLKDAGMAWATGYSDLAALTGGRIYFDVSVNTLVQRVLTVIGIAALASLYPSWQASRREPAEALHYV